MNLRTCRGLIALVLILAACGRNRKEAVHPLAPITTEIQRAEAIAKPYVYQVMSGEKRGGDLASKAAYETNTVPISVPEDFLVGRFPERLYSCYKRKYRFWNAGEDRFVRISYYDPKQFPDWEKLEGMLGGFPGYFGVTVDLRHQKVVDSYASSM